MTTITREIDFDPTVDDGTHIRGVEFHGHVIMTDLGEQTGYSRTVPECDFVEWYRGEFTTEQNDVIREYLSRNYHGITEEIERQYKDYELN